jgi:acetoin utilization deacetylase AcuC-like enzyme
MVMATGLVWDERFVWFNGGQRRHSPFYSHLATNELGQTLGRVRELLVASGVAQELLSIAPRIATEDELCAFHTPEYVARVKELSDAGGGDTGENAYIGPGCYDIARLAAGACMEATDAVLAGRVANAYALVRPAGHHAVKDFGRGYTIFANIVLAVLDAKRRRNVRRVAVVDWDVHHGNGTQQAFYTDPTVLTVSVHQAGYYPQDSGLLTENGEGPGRGYNINIPLPPGSGHHAYIATMKQVVLPALHRFKPEIILAASGLDANAVDPLGRMMCHSGTYREMALLLMDAAQSLCQGRVVACHEGGYSPTYVPWCVLAIIEAFTGRMARHQPFSNAVATWPGQELQPHQEAAIVSAAALVNNIV